jgi:hypothetical protein
VRRSIALTSFSRILDPAFDAAAPDEVVAASRCSLVVVVRFAHGASKLRVTRTCQGSPGTSTRLIDPDP